MIEVDGELRACRVGQVEGHVAECGAAQLEVKTERADVQLAVVRVDRRHGGDRARSKDVAAVADEARLSVVVDVAAQLPARHGLPHAVVCCIGLVNEKGHV